MDILNFSLLNVSSSYVGRLSPVTTTDTFEGLSKNFNPDGLYSTSIFGPVGSEERDITFSYIDIKLPIISPIIANALFELKRLYKEMLSGKRYAIWNDELKDWEGANPEDENAVTGYSAFISKFDEMVFKETDSSIRSETIELVNNYRDTCLSKYVLVIPAGIRDMEVLEEGREQEHEVNPLYRKLISIARSVPEVASNSNGITDAARWKLQVTFNEIFSFFFNFMEGKKGFWRAKVTSRNIFNGTRNVISSMDPSSPVMGREDEILATDTGVGLFQAMKGLLPVAIHAIRTRYLTEVNAGDGKLFLINKKTLNRELIKVKSDNYNLYTSDEGIEHLINGFGKMRDKNSVIYVEGHYLLLIYDDGEEFKILTDIGELPDGRSKKHVRPITFGELFYLSGYDRWNNYFGIVTRYPVTGDGSTYSSTLRVLTTTNVQMRWELRDDWTTRFEKPAIAFPDRRTNEYVSSLIPNTTRITGLGADFDGDMCSLDIIYTDDALKENRDKMDMAVTWLSADGGLTIDIVNDTVERALNALLADPVLD